METAVLSRYVDYSPRHQNHNHPQRSAWATEVHCNVLMTWDIGHRLSCFCRVIRADELAHWVSVQMLHRQAFKHLFVSTTAPHNVLAISIQHCQLACSFRMGVLWFPKRGMAPESHCSSVSLRAADVLPGSVDEMHVVIKTSTHITEEVGLCPQKTRCSMFTSMAGWHTW